MWIKTKTYLHHSPPLLPSFFFNTHVPQCCERPVLFFKCMRCLNCDLKDCIASIDIIDDMKPFWSHSSTLYWVPTVSAFGVADPMAAILFLMLGGEHKKINDSKYFYQSTQRIFSIFYLSPSCTVRCSASEPQVYENHLAFPPDTCAFTLCNTLQWI